MSAGERRALTEARHSAHMASSSPDIDQSLNASLAPSRVEGLEE